MKKSLREKPFFFSLLAVAFLCGVLAIGTYSIPSARASTCAPNTYCGCGFDEPVSVAPNTVAPGGQIVVSVSLTEDCADAAAGLGGGALAAPVKFTGGGFSSASAPSCVGGECTQTFNVLPNATAGTYTACIGFQGAGSAYGTSCDTGTVTAVAPTVTISALPTTITLGQSTTLTWSSTNTTACTASNGWSGSQSTGGTASETPGSAGTVTYTISCTGPGGSANASAAVTVANIPTGSITVTSENTKYPSIGVSASWDLTGNVSGGIVCSASGNVLWQGIPCSGTQRTYPGLPANSDSYTVPQTAKTTVSGYSFNSIEQVPIAEKKNDGIMGLVQLSLDNAFSTIANAAAKVTPGLTQTLTSSSPSAAFTILWMPDAIMQVSPTGTVSLDSLSAVTTPATVENLGTPGSAFAWSATAATASGGNWLVAPSGDSNPGVVNGQSGYASDGTTISLNSSVVSSLPNGTYHGTVTFTGTDENDSLDNNILPIAIPVTLTVNNIPVTTVTNVTPTCNPSSVLTNGTSACSATVSGTGSYGNGVTWTTTLGSINASGNYTAPGSAGTATVKACSTQSGYTNVCGTTTITVTASPPAVTVTNVTPTCNPSSVLTNGTSACTATVSGTGSYSSGVTWTTTLGSINGSGSYTAPGSAGTATVKACSTQSGYTNVCNTTTITVTASPPATTVTNVSVVCNPSSVLTNGTSACSATVSGTGSYGNGVTWTTTLGSINASGNYTAPGSTGTATVKACSTQSGYTNVCNTTTITVSASPPATTVTNVSVVCNPSSVLTNGTSACSATVSGTGSYGNGVTWTTTLGSINASGNYTAPGSAGTATVKACSTQSGYTNICGTTLVVVNSVPAAGSIVVTSENAENSSILVSASWDLMGNVSGGIVCSAASGNVLWQGIPCSGTQQTYPGLPTDNDVYTIPSTEMTTVPGYVFKSVSPAPTQTLASASPSAAFMILWTPDANMKVSPGNVSLNSSNVTTANVSVTNTGAPASALAWTATASTNSGGNWLVAPSGDTIPGIKNGSSGNASDNATVSFNSSVVSQLANGTYTGTITFQGIDENDPNNQIAPSTVSVTLTVNNIPAAVVTNVSVACNPAAVLTNGISACTATVSGTGSYSSGVTWTTTLGSVNASGNYTAPGSAGTATVKACSTQSGYTNVCGTTQITVSAPAPTVTGISVACSPSTVDTNYGTNDTSACTATVSGTGSYSSGVTWTTTLGSVNASGNYTAPGSTGTATVKACSTQSGYTNVCGTTQITVVLPTCQSSSCQATCTQLTSSLSSIVPPESTDLQSSCSNVTECELTGGGLDDIYPNLVGSVDVNVSSSPTSTTTYTLTCVNGNYSNDSTVTSVQVTAGGSSRCEQNPNGIGCSGQ